VFGVNNAGKGAVVKSERSGVSLNSFGGLFCRKGVPNCDIEQGGFVFVDFIGIKLLFILPNQQFVVLLQRIARL